jgi:hypothetical protein
MPLRLKKILVYLFLLFPFSLLAQLKEGKLLEADKLFEIPYTQSDQPILLDATIRGSTHRFILDTGAPTFISDSLQKIYNFPVVMEANLEDATAKKGKTIIVSIDTLRVGPFTFTDINALVLDFKNSPIGCESFIGNFGSNALRFLVIRFDIQSQKITLAGNHKLLGDKKEAKYFRATFSAQSDIYFDVTVNEKFKDQIHFDSGDAAFYQMARTQVSKFEKQFPKDVFQKGFGVTSMGLLGIPASGNQSKLRPSSIKFGNISLSKGIITTTERDESRLGRYLFNYGTLTIDYPRKKYSFELYESPVLPPLFDFGFTPVMDSAKVYAGTVWENSEAESNGMKSGDEIVSMNGIRFDQLQRCEIAKTIRIETKKGLAMEVVFKTKNGEEKKITLKQRILFP